MTVDQDTRQCQRQQQQQWGDDDDDDTTQQQKQQRRLFRLETQQNSMQKFLMNKLNFTVSTLKSTSIWKWDPSWWFFFSSPICRIVVIASTCHFMQKISRIRWKVWCNLTSKFINSFVCRKVFFSREANDNDKMKIYVLLIWCDIVRVPNKSQTTTANWCNLISFSVVWHVIICHWKWEGAQVWVCERACVSNETSKWVST